MDLNTWILALGVILGLGVIAWVVSVAIRNVSFVDTLWSLFFLVAAIVYTQSTTALGPRGMLVVALVAVWALRLAIYIGIRNWGEPEDYRYQAIRANNEPFAFKSLYIVFGLQGALAWFISLPLLIAITSSGELGLLDYAASLLWLVGFVFEAGGDYQLARFRADEGNRGKVLDTGLWRYTRHPNYFGDFCIWWAFFLFALAAGGWWTLFSPLLMSVLLLKVSGVAMLEKTIGERRPKYADYIANTNAFFPGLPRASKTVAPALLLALALLPTDSLVANEGVGSRSWDFDVFLDDSRIGSHRFEVDASAPGINEVRSNANFDVKVLFVNVFRYRHETSEVWSNGCLAEISSNTRSNGKRFAVNGKRTEDGFVLQNAERAVEFDECVMTFAYWNPEFLEQQRLLDPQTGEYVEVEVERLDTAPILVDGETVDAKRFRVKASNIEVTLWYSQGNDWLRLDSPAKGGRILSYRLS
jgi:steroid 5-alpha reductase family enzyme